MDRPICARHLPSATPGWVTRAGHGGRRRLTDRRRLAHASEDCRVPTPGERRARTCGYAAIDCKRPDVGSCRCGLDPVEGGVRAPPGGVGRLIDPVEATIAAGDLTEQDPAGVGIDVVHARARPIQAEHAHDHLRLHRSSIAIPSAVMQSTTSPAVQDPRHALSRPELVDRHGRVACHVTYTDVLIRPRRPTNRAWSGPDKLSTIQAAPFAACRQGGAFQWLTSQSETPRKLAMTMLLAAAVAAATVSGAGRPVLGSIATDCGPSGDGPVCCLDIAYGDSPATRLTIVARIIEPKTNDCRAWRRAAARICVLSRFVSET